MDKVYCKNCSREKLTFPDNSFWCLKAIRYKKGFKSLWIYYWIQKQRGIGGLNFISLQSHIDNKNNNCIYYKKKWWRLN